MANRAQLLNTPIFSSDPYLLAANLSEPNADYLEVAAVAYKIPIPWILCFRREDFQPVNVPLGEDEDGNPAASVEVSLPVTSVMKALDNLGRSLPVFEAIAGDAKLGKAFWQNAMTSLRGLPLPYLSLNAIEVMFMDDPNPYLQSMLAATGHDDIAIQHMTSLSNFQPGIRPYPPDVLYAVATKTDDAYDKIRLLNCVALDIGYSSYWNRSTGGQRANYKKLALFITAPTAAPNLRTLMDELSAIAKGHIQSVTVNLGFAPMNGAPHEQLKLLISPATDADCNSLVNDKEFKEMLDGQFCSAFKDFCREYGFSWAGYVIRSDESVKRRFTGDYSIYNDWVSTAT